MTVLVVSPGVPYSTADVDAGLRFGLEAHGVRVVQYRLTERLAHSRRWLYLAWQSARRVDPSRAKPTVADIFYAAGEGALAKALRHEVDAVIVVSAMFLHPDILVLMKRAGLRVTVVFTESPYEVDQELAVAALVDGCWTSERTAVPMFRAVTPQAGYLPHGWHPQRHRPGPQPGDDAVPAHDVVFVGSAFPERIAWLTAIDWTGIDLGLYGQWSHQLGKAHPLRRFVHHGTIGHEVTTALYRRAALGLNLYRAAATAESLNPRAYELAACGVCHVSTPRAEGVDVFGDLVPTVSTPAEAEQTIRTWLGDPARRAVVAAALPGRVAQASWVDRARILVGDLVSLTAAAA
jgi:spore maturation protein CgeB